MAVAAATAPDPRRKSRRLNPDLGSSVVVLLAIVGNSLERGWDRCQSLRIQKPAAASASSCQRRQFRPSWPAKEPSSAEDYGESQGGTQSTTGANSHFARRGMMALPPRELDRGAELRVP